MPQTHWKVVVVTPSAWLHARALAATWKITAWIAALELLALAAMFLAMQYFYVRPLQRMAVQMRAAVDNPPTLDTRLDGVTNPELGALASAFNQRTEHLVQVLNELDPARLPKTAKSSQQPQSPFEKHDPQSPPTH